MADDRYLPGLPKRRLVKEVRSHLWRCGIRPRGEAWLAGWLWADAIARSYYHTHWPMASEISTQYVLLLLAQMNENCSLRLPYRAGDVMPDKVAQLLADSPLEPLRIENRKRRKRKSQPSC